MHKLRKIAATNIAFRYVQLCFSFATGVLLVPIYLRHISPTDYGAWLACSSVLIWLTVFDPGIANIIIQKIGSALGQGNYDSVNGYINAGLTSSFIVSISILLFGYVGSFFIINFIGIEASNASLPEAFRIATFTTALVVMGYAVTGVNYGLQASIEIGFASIAAMLCKITTILLMLKYKYGLLSLPYGDFASSIFILFSGIIILLFRIRFLGIVYKPSLTQLRELLGLFMISFGARFSKVVVRNFDNIVIARLLGPEFVTIYSLAATIPRQAESIIAQPISALRPSIAHLSGIGNLIQTQRIVLLISRLSIWSMGLIMTGLCVFNDSFVQLWVGKNLFAGHLVTYCLCTVFLLNAWTNIFGTLGFSLGDIIKNNQFEWISSILLIPAIVIGVYIFGMPGAALAHIIVILFTTAWYFPVSLVRKLSLKSKDHRLLMENIIECFLAAMVTFLLFCFVSPQRWVSFIVYALALVAFYICFIFCISRTFRSELLNVQYLFRKLEV